MAAQHETDGPAGACVLLGVDVGGTFTDAVLLHGSRLHAAKVGTTTNDQSIGVLAAVDAVLAQCGEAVVPRRFAHGTTTATNALLERRGARVAAVFTEGFADLLEIARQDRPYLYRPNVPRTPPLVPRRRVVTAPERVTARGVARRLEPSDVDAVTAAVAALDPESVAICLLHSYADAHHEQLIAAALRDRLPATHVVASHELTREFREFERASTTAIDAYLTPVLRPYLERLGQRADERSLPRPLVMQSNGGLDDLDAVAAHAARAVLSGPAGGVVAAATVAAALEVESVLCFDIGGTSCDVALAGPAGAGRSAERTVAGLPLQLELVDMHTVGAGGSSIVSLDLAGALQVGPRSAGSTPGPAAYGRGGTDMTLSDAHLLLGALRADSMRHWGIDLHPDLARAAARRVSADEPLVVAAGAVALATAHMTEAARVVSVARGADPSAMALLAYGGAGGLHACDVAEALGCELVIVPTFAGVLSALGLAGADVRRERARTVRLVHADDASVELPPPVSAWIARQAGMLRDDLRRHGIPRTVLACDMRFHGQSHTLPVEVAISATSPAQIEAALQRAAVQFRTLHERRYGFVLDGHAIETVTVRVACIVDGPPLVLQPPEGVPHDWRLLERTVDGGTRAIDLPHGTCLLPAGWHVAGLRSGCLLVRREVVR